MSSFLRERIQELEAENRDLSAMNEGLKVKLQKAEVRAKKFKELYDQIKDQHVLAFEGSES